MLAPSEQRITQNYWSLAPDGCRLVCRLSGLPIQRPDQLYYSLYAFSDHAVTSSFYLPTRDRGGHDARHTGPDAAVVTRTLGLTAANETTLELPVVGGGRKLMPAGYAFPSAAGRFDDPDWQRLWRVTWDLVPELKRI
ncbi:hypothetical protein Q2406_03255 [Klebsiella pneumoniae]|nr:hypothetical protein [Klebsiella pneumoniae]